MCHKLVQIYACGHPKDICTTPCPHALDTGPRIPQVDSDNNISRSNSTVSSIAPSVRRDELPSQLHSSMPSPLRVSSPASRFNASNLPSPVGPPLGYPGHSPTSPTAPASRWSTNPQNPPTSPSLTNLPHLPDEEFTIEPNFCPYHFPRYLPQSNHPCLDCYFLPEWEHLAAKYVRSYRECHPLNKAEDAEKLSGVEGLRERHIQRQWQNGKEGLLNVFVTGDESAGRV